MSAVKLRDALSTDVTRCFQIESSAYDGEEAATFEKIRTRVSQYPEGFLILEVEDEVIGFINSGCAYEVIMSDEEFKELIGHAPEAPNVVIMSVVLEPKHQGKGYSTLLMRHFVDRMKALGKETIHLMCKGRHVELYRRMGYQYVRPSVSDHGGMAWHEMVMLLR